MGVAARGQIKVLNIVKDLKRYYLVDNNRGIDAVDGVTALEWTHMIQDSTYLIFAIESG